MNFNEQKRQVYYLLNLSTSSFHPKTKKKRLFHPARSSLPIYQSLERSKSNLVSYITRSHPLIVKLHIAIAILQLRQRILVTHIDIVILALAVAVVRQNNNVTILELDASSLAIPD